MCVCVRERERERGVCILMFTVLVNEHDDSSTNPGPDSLDIPEG